MDILDENVEEVIEKDEEVNEVKKKKSFKVKLINFIIILLMLFLSVYMYSKYLGVKGIIVKEYTIKSANIPDSFDGNKIIYFSDTLLGSTVNIEDFKKIKDEINLYKPDILIFGGDLIFNNSFNEEEIISILSEMNASLGKYFTLGSLDSDSVKNILIKSGFIDIDNKDELIYSESLDPICLSGIGSYNLSLYDFTNVFKCQSTFKIATSHEPDIIDSLKTYNPDVILSANTLGGEISFPYTNGLETFDGSKNYKDEQMIVDNMQVFISTGIGTKKQFKRLFNRPSFNLFRLKKLSQK